MVDYQWFNPPCPEPFDKINSEMDITKFSCSDLIIVYVVSDISLCYQKQPRDFCCISVEAREVNISELSMSP